MWAAHTISWRLKREPMVLLGLLLGLPLSLLLTSNALADIGVVDFYGREVHMAKPAERIVALAPHIVENTFTAGAGDKLVGVIHHSNYPAQAKNIEEVGDYKAWSMEAIVALQPDLILMWGSAAPMGSLDTLERLNIPVYVSEPRRLQDIAKNIRDIGVLAGRESMSETAATSLEQQLMLLTKKFQSQKKLRVFYQVWHTPLQTISGDHMISDIMRLCGAQNVFADALSLAPKIGLEAVIQRNPDAIITSGQGGEKPEWLDQWQQYPSLKAVQNKALLFIHPDHIKRPTARILLGAQVMCEQLDRLRAQTGETASFVASSNYRGAYGCFR
ncbi:MAG: cobalamin-binding protein [Gammaproteobacteria bacterium]|nr:cobalamin-binding protein [Gammaproteobacteria bacterium]